MKVVSPWTTVENELLPYVRRPHRYAGLDHNRIVKEDAEVTVALAFPDLYEIGMSWLGMQILYHRLNRFVAEVACERVFLPEEDASKRIRELGIPLFTLENRVPLCDVDMVGISLSYEMAMPGMLELMDLGNIPIYRDQRKEDDPIILLGGSVCYNPEPVADFADLICVGEGDEVIVTIGEILRDSKRKSLSKLQTINKLAEIDGVFRPDSLELNESENGNLIVKAGTPLVTGITVCELMSDFYPDAPLVPQTEITFDRISLEIMRGCTRGCRFCQAGTLYRPVRERKPDDIIDQAIKNIKSTGYNELSLMSLSTSDYSPLPELIMGLRDAFHGQGVALAFPSLRPDSFTPEMARAMPGTRKGGLTFAPEAGSQRLRNVINKNSSEEDLLRAAELGFSEGYNSIKLYYMIGLPTETYLDLDGIVDLSQKVTRLRTKKSQKVTVSVSPFAPKAHTPFQRFGQDTTLQLREKLNYLREKFKKLPVKYAGHNPSSAILESALARGDRRLSKVVENVWRSGGVLEAWNDRFNQDRWTQAFADADLSPESYVKQIDSDVLLPWHYVTKGVNEKFQKKEMEKATTATPTFDCREGKCTACGLNSFIDKETKVCSLYASSSIVPSPATPETKKQGEVALTARIHYHREEGMRWTGHLDMVRLWDRFLRRAEIPVAFSQGFHPHPKLSYSPPLPVGLTSDDEYIDIDLDTELNADVLLEKLQKFSPDGLSIEEVITIDIRLKTITAQIERIEYQFCPADQDDFKVKLDDFLSKDEWIVKRMSKKKLRDVNLRLFVESVEQLDSDVWQLNLNLINGATARLDELGKVWGLGAGGLGPDAKRSAMYIKSNDGWKRPVHSLSEVITRAKRLDR
jgi:radical SAM family uncharacterized protein/radical SAM-linked protein